MLRPICLLLLLQIQDKLLLSYVYMKLHLYTCTYPFNTNYNSKNKNNGVKSTADVHKQSIHEHTNLDTQPDSKENVRNSLCFLIRRINFTISLVKQRDFISFWFYEYLHVGCTIQNEEEWHFLFVCCNQIQTWQ